MKRGVILVGMVVVVLVAFGGSAAAKEMMGTVTAVDAGKGTLTIKSETVEVGFDCEKGSMVSGIKMGDHVKVKYTESLGKKKATSVTPVMIKRTAPVGC